MFYNQLFQKSPLGDLGVKYLIGSDHPLSHILKFLHAQSES
jgi:hypothetical protein